MVVVLKASGLWEEGRCDPPWTNLGLPQAVKKWGCWSPLPKSSSSSPRCEGLMLAFQSWSQKGTLLGRALRTWPSPGSLRAAGQEGSGTGVTRGGLQPCVSWDWTLFDSPDAAVLRMVLKRTGMLILHSSTLCTRGGSQMPPPSGQVGCSCTAAGPKAVRPKEGQTTLRSDTQSIFPATAVLDPSTGA